MSTDYYSDILRHFDKLGIEPGMHLLVHCGVRYIGGRAARPKELVAHLIERLGEEGCLLMPTFQNDRRLEDYIFSDPLYDPKSTPSQTGALSQIFWEEFRARRSYHPWLAVAAKGQDYMHYIKEHHLDLKPHSFRSPFYKLMHNPKGYILLLGVNQRNNASLYVLENIEEDYPYQALLDEPVTMRYLDYEGIQHKMHTLLPNRKYQPRLGQWGNDLQQMYPQMGQKLHSELGYEVTLLHAGTFLECQRKAMRGGMYHHNEVYSPKSPWYYQIIPRVKRALGIKGRIL